MRRRITMGSPWRLNYCSVGANEPQPQRAGHHSDREVVMEVPGAESLIHRTAKAAKKEMALVRPSRSGVCRLHGRLDVMTRSVACGHVETS